MLSSEQTHSPTSPLSSPIPKINIKLADNNSNDNNNKINNNNNLASSPKKSTSRSRSPGPRPKSPSGDSNNRSGGISNKLMTSPKRSTSRSRSPRPKSPSSKETPVPSSSPRSKSPHIKQHNRADSDNMLTNFSSQDVRQNLKSLHPWIGATSPTTSSGSGSRNQNRLSLPPDYNATRIRQMNEQWEKLNLIPMELPKDGKNSMGNFSKTTSLRVAPILRPKLAVETFNKIPGSKSMQRTTSGPYSGNNNSSPLLTADGFPLIRSRSYNSAVEDISQLSSPSFDKEILPLQHSWTMYYDSKPVMTPGPKPQTGKHTYEENLQTIGTFNNVQLFCRYFNWVKKPSQLEMNTNFHLFKDKIKPMWEDPANANGGKWVISMKGGPHNNQLLDNCWTWLVYALVGEELDEADDICGAVMSRRSRGDRIAVWVRDKDNVSVINGIGKRLLKILDLQNEKGISMDFQFNEDALKSGTSYNNRTYLSLESLKLELESAEKSKDNNNTEGSDTKGNNVEKKENDDNSAIDNRINNDVEKSKNNENNTVAEIANINNNDNDITNTINANNVNNKTNSDTTNVINNNNNIVVDDDYGETTTSDKNI